MTQNVQKINTVVTLEEIQKAKELIQQIYVDDKVKNYIVDLVLLQEIRRNTDLPI